VEADSLFRPNWPDSQAPRLDIDAVIPETGLARGDGDVYGTGDVERGPMKTSCGMSYVDLLAVDGDGEGGRLQLFGNRRCLYARGRVGGDGEREEANQKRAKNQQEPRPQLENGNRPL